MRPDKIKVKKISAVALKPRPIFVHATKFISASGHFAKWPDAVECYFENHTDFSGRRSIAFDGKSFTYGWSR